MEKSGKMQEKRNSIILACWLGGRRAVDEGLVLYGSRIVVPKNCRREVLERLHDSHQGIERTKRRARQSVYWPGINSDITNMVQACEACQERLPSLPKEPMQPDEIPTRVFESVSMDLFSHGGKHFLVYADRYSGWPEVEEFRNDPTSAQVIKVLRKHFGRTGIPKKIRSDGGPQFASREFAESMEKWKVEHLFSSPHYPQSNGHAESAVKAMKALVAKTTTNGNLDSDEFARGILEFRNTPRDHGYSPAEILYGQPMRSLVPTYHEEFAPRWREMAERIDTAMEEKKLASKKLYDQHAKKLPNLEKGTEVRFQNHVTGRWDRTGVIVDRKPFRKYVIQAPSGRLFERNRRFIRVFHQEAELAKEEPASHKPKEVMPRRGTRDRKKTVRFKV